MPAPDLRARSGAHHVYVGHTPTAVSGRRRRWTRGRGRNGVGVVLPEDRALLARLRRVNTAVADVVVELLNHLDGGELPADALRVLGQRLGELGHDLVAHADRRDATLAVCEGQPVAALCDSGSGRRAELHHW
jgi:hypothetical protein